MRDMIFLGFFPWLDLLCHVSKWDSTVITSTKTQLPVSANNK